MSRLNHPALHDLVNRLKRDETLPPSAFRRFWLALQEADTALTEKQDAKKTPRRKDAA